jgi:galactose-1-phosphate uridylyltransferase
LTPEEHHLFMKFTRSAAAEIMRLNSHVTYVSVFQNWLKPAGASFDHLHKQLVGSDTPGPLVQKKLELLNEGLRPLRQLLDMTAAEGLWIASNDHAIALADTGQPHPAVLILSLGRPASLNELSADALRGLSDLIHACHAAWDHSLPANEEWCHSPKDATASLPFHVVIKWRMNTPAGFEGATGIHINPVAPHDLRDAMVERMMHLRHERRIAPVKIGEESLVSCPRLDY